MANMNYNHLTDNEFLNYITLEGSNDPIVSRLIKIITNDYSIQLRDELIRQGMDAETWEMDYEGLSCSPAEYIQRLENDIDWKEREYSDLSYDLDEARVEIEKLKTRSIAQLIAELHEELSKADRMAADAKRIANAANDAAELAKSKLKVWNYLQQ